MRVHLDPTGYANDFASYDTVFLLNLTNQSLPSPEFGVVKPGGNPSFMQPLLRGDFSTDPLFGGSGPLTVSTIGAFGVYETLIPQDGTTFNFGDALGVTLGVTLEDGQVSFAPVPEPSGLALLLGGLAPFGFIRRAMRRRRQRQNEAQLSLTTSPTDS